MRRFVAALTLVLGLALVAPTSASAGVEDGLFGLNGVLTFVADPINGLVVGDDRFEVPVVAPVTNRLVGLVTGTITGVVRLATGTADVLTCPLTGPVGGPFSPDAFLVIVPGTGEPLGLTE